ncbi:alpha/beta fold hydrolase [Patescibacteria group bacterium]|nr:alpha/beta fold hydrolase [Patescibacteria group bacterium]
MAHLNKKTLATKMTSVLGIILFIIPLFGSFSPLPAHATAPVVSIGGSNDVQYSTVLDYSANTILLKQGGYVATSTYTCVIATQGCVLVPSSTTTLAPSALASTSNFVSPDYSEALVTTYVANSNPTEQLYGIQNNVLAPQATLPALKGLITNVHWSGDNTVLIIKESDGSTQKYNRTTNTLTTLKTSLPSGAAWITLSADGRYIAYYIPAVISTGKRTFGVIDTNLDIGYTLESTISYWDLLSEGVRIFAFSPDSTRLLYLDDRSGYQTLYAVNMKDLATTGLTGTQVTAKKYTIEDMQWEDNSSIVFSANRDNPMQWSLYELNLGTYTLKKIVDSPAYNQPMHALGSNILFQTADANGRLTKVFNTLTKTVSAFQTLGLDQSKVGTTNQVVQQGGVYGAYLPTTVATSTLLVWLHGGPDRQTSLDYNSYMSYGGYDWVLNKVQASGVPVLKLDYPGSINHGTAFAQSIKNGVGTVDASTTMQAIKDFSAAHGFKNVYVMGNSYGGYLALKLLVSYPSQIKGAYSLSGVTDWQTLLTNIPSSIFSLDFNGSPNPLNQALYNKASIVANIPNIGTQKVIVTQGDADSEVPYAQSQLIDEALVAAGKNVEYSTLAGEDHIYKLPSSYTLVCNQALELVGLPSNSLCTMH